jgi:hypothetical protein
MILHLGYNLNAVRRSVCPDHLELCQEWFRSWQGHPSYCHNMVGRSACHDHLDSYVMGHKLLLGSHKLLPQHSEEVCMS